MKIKVLLPVERQGLFVLQGDPNLTFYQFIQPLLKKYNIEATEYYIKDTYGRRFSMTKPMGQAGFYPGISLEFFKNEPGQYMDAVKNPIAADKVKLTLNLYYWGREPVTIEVNRYQTVQAVLLVNKIVSEIPENLIVLFNKQAFPVFFELDEIGILGDCSIDLIASQLQAENETENVDNPDVQETNFIKDDLDSTKMTKADYARMQSEQYRWRMEMGHGQFVTEAERQTLKQGRMDRKGVLMFKVISTQMRRNLNIKFNVEAGAKLEDLYKEFNSILLKKFGNDVDSETLAKLFNGYKLRAGRGGNIIFASEFSAYDHFDGGDALLDMEVDDEFLTLQW